MCIYIYIYICMYVCMYIYIYIYIYIYTHTNNDIVTQAEAGGEAAERGLLSHCSMQVSSVHLPQCLRTTNY